MTPVDTSLEETVTAGRAVARNRGAAFQLQLPDRLSGDWVSVTKDGAKVSLRPASRAPKMVGSVVASISASVPASITARATGASLRAYAGAFSGADLTYESRPDGVKETIVVSAPTSATAFSFDLATSGLTPRAEPDGSISLLKAGQQAPAMVIPRPGMWDSDETTGAAYSDQVHYELSGDGPTYRLDVVVDPAWMNDPARVYPINVDPGVWTMTGGTYDTYVSSGAQTTNYSASTLDYFDNHYSGADWSECSLFQPGSAWTADLAAKKAAGYQVAYASLRLVMWQHWGGARQIGASMCSTSTAVTMSTVTWNTKPGTVSGYSVPAIAATTNDGASDTWNITGATQYWQQASTASNKATLYFSDTTSGTRSSYKSSENSGTTPLITVDYTVLPQVTLVDPSADAPLEGTPVARWEYSDADGKPQGSAEVSIRSAPSGSDLFHFVGSVDPALRSIVCTGTSLAPGRYFVRMRASGLATDSTGVPMETWSDWTDWTPFEYRSLLAGSDQHGIVASHASDDLGGGARVDLATGRLQISRNDFSGPGLASDLGVTMGYDSASTTSDVGLGAGWRIATPSLVASDQVAGNPGFEIAGAGAMPSGWSSSAVATQALRASGIGIGSSAALQLSRSTTGSVVASEGLGGVSARLVYPGERFDIAYHVLGQSFSAPVSGVSRVKKSGHFGVEIGVRASGRHPAVA
jgi:hypothetical protein